MEITLDIGKNILSEIEVIAKIEKIDIDIFALKMLDLGLKIYQSSKENSENLDNTSLESIFKKCLENNFLLKEMVSHVFVKDKSAMKAYDYHTVISFAENMSSSFIDGKKENNYF